MVCSGVVTARVWMGMATTFFWAVSRERMAADGCGGDPIGKGKKKKKKKKWCVVGAMSPLGLPFLTWDRVNCWWTGAFVCSMSTVLARKGGRGVDGCVWAFVDSLNLRLPRRRRRSQCTVS